jgi:nitrogen fixation-related uncharacterized protein
MMRNSRKWWIGAAAGLLLALVPASAFAHDNVGGDELAVANWMLVGAIITIVIGVIWGVWALRTGQFNNVEESKYRMLELADDYDAIMADVDARERSLREAEAAAKLAAQTAAPTRQNPGEALAGGKAH